MASIKNKHPHEVTLVEYDSDVEYENEVREVAVRDVGPVAETGHSWTSHVRPVAETGSSAHHYAETQEALVAYFRDNDFLQSVAKHIQQLESRAGPHNSPDFSMQASRSRQNFLANGDLRAAASSNQGGADLPGAVPKKKDEAEHLGRHAQPGTDGTAMDSANSVCDQCGCQLMRDCKFCRKCGRPRKQQVAVVSNVQDRSHDVNEFGRGDEVGRNVTRGQSVSDMLRESSAKLDKCKECGYRVVPDAESCRKCGTKVDKKDTMDSEKQDEDERRPTLKQRNTKTLEAQSANNQKELPKAAVFADADAMKEKVRMAIHRKPYDVKELYKSEGYAQLIARSGYFEYITLGIISFNAIWISIDADNNKAATLHEAEPIFIFAENFFCCYFLAEWAIRFTAFEDKRSCVKDAWFVFDSVLVVCMVCETWVLAFAASVGNIPMSDTSILKLIRVTRLTRMARLAKLLQAMPELLVLIKGIFVAARSVFYTLVLLAGIIYVFSVMFRQLTDETDVGRKYFGTVPKSMASLLVYGVLPDLAPLIEDMHDDSYLFAVLVLLFILLASLTVMNMLVGVLVEVVSVVSAVEKEELSVMYVKDKLKTLIDACSDIDVDGDMKISAREFTSLLLVPAAASAIQDVGVDPVGLIDFADFIFHEQEFLTFGDFIEILLQFRGSNGCTVKDIVEVRRYLMTELRNIEMVLNHNTEMLSMATGEMPFTMAAARAENEEQKKLQLAEIQRFNEEESIFRPSQKRKSGFGKVFTR
jgi:ribosomal protein L40E